MEYSFFKTISKQYKTAINKEKKYYVYLLYFLEFISKGSLPVISMFLLQIVLDLIGTNEFDYVRNRIIIIGVILVVLAIISIICETMQQAIFIKIRMKEFVKIGKLYNEINYELVENEAFNEEFQGASRTLDGDNMGYQGTFTNIFYLLPQLAQIIIYAVLLIMVNPLILVAVLISALISIFINKRMFKYQKSKRRDINKAYQNLNYYDNVLTEYQYGKDIRMFSMQDYLSYRHNESIASYKTILKDIANKRYKYSFLELLGLLILDSTAFFLIVLAYYHARITIGELAMYLSIVIAMSTTIRGTADLIQTLVRNVKYTSDYYTFLDKYQINPNWGNKVVEVGPLEIEFKNVSFKYPNSDNLVIKDLNLKIKSGEKLAIVGENGAGKTTIIKLLCGLFRPTSGVILVNGIPIDEYQKEEYFKMIACVFQDVNIYTGTVLENICGDDETRIDEAKEALNIMGLKDKIESLPKGYNHPLTKALDDDGVDLSGGEAQKLSIARALYKGGGLVILDEPTAALDALAEANIYANFDTLVKGKTAIYISHRLSSTKFCDHIALFSKEGLIEYGTHEELMAQCGHYHEMFMIQGKYYKEAQDEN